MNEWQDHQFTGWATEDGETFIDDDLLGYMIAEAAKTEGESGSASVRRAVLEITRAVSLTPWSGDVTFNAASPGATPSAAKKGQNPVPYGTEVHATRYQFGPRDDPRAIASAEPRCGRPPGDCIVANCRRESRPFLFDFSPESIVLRVTDDPAPRLLYCFDTEDGGKSTGLSTLTRRVESGDVRADELVIGGEVCEGSTGEALRKAGVKSLHSGVKAAVEAACEKINSQLAPA